MSLLGAAANLGGSIFSTVSNKKEGKRNRRFQERLSRNAYSYATEDMKNAGLNPAAMFGKGGSGSPGSTPSGAMPQVGNPVSDATAYSLSKKAQKKEGELIDAQVASAKELAGKTRDERVALQLQNKLSKFDYDTWMSPDGQEARRVGTRSSLLPPGVAQMTAFAEILKNIAESDPEAGWLYNMIFGGDKPQDEREGNSGKNPGRPMQSKSDGKASSNKHPASSRRGARGGTKKVNR